jgi:hypothetical protein
MATALRLARRHFWSGHSKKDDIRLDAIGQKPVTGDAARLKQAQHQSEQLVEDAIAYDVRLAKKSQWLRRDEGEHVCAALLAEGDDQPFYKRHRATVNEATMAGEPMRIVVSTDDNNVPPGTAAAFIAVARLVQQFTPLEVWWQGAWLTDDETRGFVFTVPLLQGDQDFSRLEFCIADEQRDMFSYHVMATHAVLDLKESWNSCGHRATIAYHPTEKYSNGRGKGDFRATTKFITHHGIMPTAESVANTAAHWLGWQSHSTEQWKRECDASSAGQSIPTVYKGGYAAESAADRLRWEKQQAAQKAKSKQEAQERLAA